MEIAEELAPIATRLSGTFRERYELLRTVERVRWLHDRLVKSPNDDAYYFAGLLRRAREG